MSQPIPESVARAIMERVERASTRAELEAIREILLEYDEDDPKVKELVYVMRRK